MCSQSVKGAIFLVYNPLNGRRALRGIALPPSYLSHQLDFIQLHRNFNDISFSSNTCPSSFISPQLTFIQWNCFLNDRKMSTALIFFQMVTSLTCFCSLKCCLHKACDLPPFITNSFDPFYIGYGFLIYIECVFSFIGRNENLTKR